MKADALKFILILVIASLFSGCVTEVIGPPERKADPVKYLQNLIDLGIGYLQMGDYQRAKEKLTLALEQDPKSSTVHTTIGLLYQLQREDKLAEQHFKKAIRYDVDHSQGRMNYGAFLFQQGNYKQALKQLSRAAADTSYRGRPQALENLGVCYLHLQDPKAAEAAFLKALALNSGLKRASLELAQLRFDQLKYTESLKHYRNHLSVAQQSAKSLWLGIRLARIFNNTDEESSYGLVLKNIFPASEEYRKYQGSVR